MISRRNLNSDEIERVVVRGTNWVGDAVMTIPALRSLRRLLPNAHITLVIRPSIRSLFEEADFIDELLVYDRGRAAMRAFLRQSSEWRTRRFDLAILLQNAFEAALLGFIAQVPARLGYATDGRSFLLTHPIAVPSWRGNRHEVFYYLNIIAELEKLIHKTSDLMEREPEFGLELSKKRQSEARKILLSSGAHQGRQLVALCPGSTNSRAKRWPAERFAILADKIIEEFEADVVLIGSPDEVDVSVGVADLMKSKPIMLTGRTELSEAVAVLSLADVLVTNDTGPAHISAALNRPTLVIFGPTDPVTTAPYSASAQVIRQPPDCAPCMLRDCPIDHRCMTAIDPDEVFSRVLALLKEQTVGVHR